MTGASWIKILCACVAAHDARWIMDDGTCIILPINCCGCISNILAVVVAIIFGRWIRLGLVGLGFTFFIVQCATAKRLCFIGRI